MNVTQAQGYKTRAKGRKKKCLWNTVWSWFIALNAHNYSAAASTGRSAFQSGSESNFIPRRPCMINTQGLKKKVWYSIDLNTKTQTENYRKYILKFMAKLGQFEDFRFSYLYNISHKWRLIQVKAAAVFYFIFIYLNDALCLDCLCCGGKNDNKEFGILNACATLPLTFNEIAKK